MRLLINFVLMVMIAVKIMDLSAMVHPVSFCPPTDSLRQAAIRIGIGDPGEHIMKAIAIASKQTGLSETFILSLMFTESSLNPKAVSSKNYQGLMQIPSKWAPLSRYEDVNVLVGARIFQEKLRMAEGDYCKAIVMYKGWNINHPEGVKQAHKVLALNSRLKEEV